MFMSRFKKYIPQNDHDELSGLLKMQSLEA
jgi:hypothetical protein